MHADIKWPKGKPPAQADFQSVALESIHEIVGSIFAATCYSPEMKPLLKNLYKNELVAARIAMVTVTSNNYYRILGRPFTRLADLVEADDEIFPKLERPILHEPQDHTSQVSTNPVDSKSHRDRNVRSVINTHLWDLARWKGALFASYGKQTPPVIAFAYEQKEPAEKIFRQWRERFGESDADDSIYISIIRGVSATDPAHYTILVTSSLKNGASRPTSQPIAFLGRFQTMTPSTTDNLDQFLRDYEQVGVYLLAPAILNQGSAQPLMNHAILKRKLVVRQYDDVESNDIEVMAFPHKYKRHRDPIL